MLDIKKIEAFVEEFPGNYVSEEAALSKEVAGMKMYDTPLVAVGDVNDPMFLKLKEPQAIGPHFWLPQEWLPEAKRVISLFFPFTERVKKSNTAKIKETSQEWQHARIEGQKFILDACRFIVSELEKDGEQAVIPALSGDFWSVERPGTNPRVEDSELGYTSNWSERHVAFVCGLGTFCLSKGLITEKGVCGRFASVITTAELPVTKRLYEDVYEYCNQCGACIRNCPVHAISMEHGKDHESCREYVDETKVRYAPRYGCGKCQVDVPCMSKIPPRRKK